MRIAIIARDAADSPNMTVNDAAILEMTAQELRDAGTEVVMIDNGTIPRGTDIVCTMSRKAETLERLKEAEEQGVIVVNSTAAIGNCSRRCFMRILEEAEIPQPSFCEVRDEKEFTGLHFPAWIKHSEGWSRHKNDVCFAKDAQQAAEAFRQMRARGIDTCIHCNHIEGDIIKFYGVGHRYFHYSYPSPEKSKFGLEKINGVPNHHPFNPDKLKEIVFTAAKAIGLDIYGGDCIINSKGEISVIDINDFPSFSAVRNEAAKEIATYILNF